MRKYQLLYYPSDSTVEMVRNPKTRLSFSCFTNQKNRDKINLRIFEGCLSLSSFVGWLLLNVWKSARLVIQFSSDKMGCMKNKKSIMKANYFFYIHIVQTKFSILYELAKVYQVACRSVTKVSPCDAGEVWWVRILVNFKLFSKFLHS